MRAILPTILLALLAACQATEGDRQPPAEGGRSEAFRNEIAVAVGEFQQASEKGARFGIDYERRAPEGWGTLFDERWGFGAFADFYVDPVESFFVAAQAVYHPIEPLSLIVAGGFDNDDLETAQGSWVLRLGTRYAIDLADNVAIGPELFYDVLEEGDRRGILALAFVYRF